MHKPLVRSRSDTHYGTLTLVVVLGVLFGLGAYPFSYAEGASYFVDDPNACMNCHVMQEPFEGWSRSSHKAIATCNDCHTPRSFPENWMVKGLNGWNHGWAFSSGNFPDPIRIKEFNAQITQQNCVTCHETLVRQTHPADPRQELSCVACHGDVGHGEQAQPEENTNEADNDFSANNRVRSHLRCSRSADSGGGQPVGQYQ